MHVSGVSCFTCKNKTNCHM